MEDFNRTLALYCEDPETSPLASFRAFFSLFGHLISAFQKTLDSHVEKETRKQQLEQRSMLIAAVSPSLSYNIVPVLALFRRQKPILLDVLLLIPR